MGLRVDGSKDRQDRCFLHGTSHAISNSRKRRILYRTTRQKKKTNGVKREKRYSQITGSTWGRATSDAVTIYLRGMFHPDVQTLRLIVGWLGKRPGTGAKDKSGARWVADRTARILTSWRQLDPGGHAAEGHAAGAGCRRRLLFVGLNARP